MRDVSSFSLVCKIWHDALLHSNIDIPVTINNKNYHWNWNWNLTHIILNPSVNWSHDELKKFAQQLKQKSALKILNLQISKLCNVSDEIIKCFVEKCINLHTINFNGCQLIDR